MVDNPTFYFFSYRTAIRYHLSKRLALRGWKEAANEESATLKDENLTLNDDVSKHFEYKHLLANLIQKHCPEVMPATYWINDENYSDVLAKANYEHYYSEGKFHSQKPNVKWILKPSTQNNGDNIKLFDSIEEVRQYYAQPHRLGGDHVLQQYLSEPDLIDGRKYTFRLPVVLSNFAGAFIYREGYVNISGVPFDLSEGLKIRKMHITNYVLDGVLSNIEQRSTHTLPNFDNTFLQMQEIVTQCVRALLKEYPSYLQGSPKRFEIFGFDFAMDKHNRVWLLEINQGPDAPTFEENPMNAILWEKFWQNIIDDFVIPSTLETPPKNNYRDFAKLSLLRTVWDKLKSYLK